MKALIVEDEPRARSHMIKLLAEHFPEVEVAGALGSVKDTLRWIETQPAPDVIFSSKYIRNNKCIKKRKIREKSKAYI